ncbi:MAG: hypothetical protein WBV94_12130 [Blastocatellia bacterium]
MKRFAIFLSLILICLTATSTAFGQKGCEFNPVGTWKAAASDEKTPTLFRFTPDAKVTMLSGSGQGSELREIASAVYTLDNPKAPKTILVKAGKNGGSFAEGITSMEITGYDDTSLTFVKPGSAPSRWVRVDSNRYFLVLAGRIGTFYDGSGPTFPMLIKMDGEKTQIDAVGTYDVRGYWAFGLIPAETYKEFMKEPRKDSEVMLRLEITAAQYERGLKIVKSWVRRAQNNELLYPDLTMDNILVAKQVTESLNQCGEKFKLYKLDWSMEDRISNSLLDSPPISRIPFMYFRELKRLNESLHVPDEKFHEAGHPMQQRGDK